LKPESECCSIAIQLIQELLVLVSNSLSVTISQYGHHFPPNDFKFDVRFSIVIRDLQSLMRFLDQKEITYPRIKEFRFAYAS
jgi:hypothetical protein